MWFRNKIKNKVYDFYLKGIAVQYIADLMNLKYDDVENIIDYMNELYN